MSMNSILNLTKGGVLEQLLLRKEEDLSSITHKNILVIDDDKEFSRILEIKLSSPEYFLSYAKDSREALLKMAWRKPDLILLDVYLPGLDGVEFAKALKQRNDLKDIPVIVITQDRNPRIRIPFQQMNVHDFELKPINVSKLKKHVRQILYE